VAFGMGTGSTKRGYELGIVGGKTKIGDVDKAGALSFGRKRKFKLARS